MKPPGPAALQEFGALIVAARDALGPVTPAREDLESVSLMVRRVVVRAMQDGLIPYCPRWEVSMAPGDNIPTIHFDWTAVLTADWRDIYIPAFH